MINIIISFLLLLPFLLLMTNLLDPNYPLGRFSHPPHPFASFHLIHLLILTAQRSRPEPFSSFFHFWTSPIW